MSRARADLLRDGLFALPGGVPQYKKTLDEMLEAMREQPLSEEELFKLLAQHYEVTGEKARVGYANVLVNVGLVRVREGRYQLTPEGETYLLAPEPRALFERLHRAYTGLLEIFVIASALGRAETERINELLPALLGATWKSLNQAAFRRNWLLSVGATERRDDGDVLTALGRQILKAHDAEVALTQTRLDNIVAERRDLRTDLEGVEEVEPEIDLMATALTTSKPIAAPTAVPSAWDADRLDLKAERAAGHALELELPNLLLEQACAALSSGKHLLLVGPPGTGKTELALALTAAARSDGYCGGAFVATASADWTPFNTIGGYALQKDSSLSFRPGVFLKAIERFQSDDAAYARLLEAHAMQKGIDPALPEGALESIHRLFRSNGLFAYRAIGPAVALDMLRYMRRRQASGDGLAEAMALYLLPQLEGLEQEPASKALELLLGSLAGWTSTEAMTALRRRYQEIFSHLTFGNL